MKNELQDQLPKLPKKKIYLFPSIGISLLLIFNLYYYRTNEDVLLEIFSLIAFLMVFGIYFSNSFHDVLILRKAKQMAAGIKYVSIIEFEKQKTFARAYTILFGIVATILLIKQVFISYQIYIDVVFFVFLTIEFYRGYNANFQTKILHKLLNEILEEKKNEDNDNKLGGIPC